MRKFALVILLAFVAGTLSAAEPAKISVSFSDVDVTQALSEISQKAQISILGDSSVRGKVSCQLNGVTAEQVLDAICKMNKLEWVKAYTSPGADGRVNVSRTFQLLDSLKELGTSSIVFENSATGKDTIFVPGADREKADTAGLTTKLSLRPLYLVRAIPEPAKEEVATQAQPPSAFPQDVQVAAQEVWGYIGQMPTEQRWQVMGEMRRMMFESMTPEQREAMFRSFRERGRDGRPDGGRDRRGDGQRPPRPQ